MKYEVIMRTLDGREFLKRLEKVFIKKENTRSPNGYNLTNGGDGASSGESNLQYRHDISTDEIIRLKSAGFRREEIAEFLGCSVPLIYRRLKKLGLTEEGLGGNKLRRDIRNEDIIRMYNQGMRLKEIARQLGCEGNTVINRLRRVGMNCVSHNTGAPKKCRKS
jgi:DNA-binding CsgD family transcriptional regulator